MTHDHRAPRAHVVLFSHLNAPEPVATPTATAAAREVRFSGRQAAPASAPR